MIYYLKGDIMIFKEWNENTYFDFINYLKEISEEEYKNFHKKLCITKYEILGIRLPILRKLAKEISKTNYIEFFKLCKKKYYEEIMIILLITSQIKEEKEFYKYFKEHIKLIDNWALCDTFCNSIKIVEKYPEKYFKECLKLSLNEKEFISRVGLITILFHFIEEKNLDEIFNILNKIDSNKYYINMAQAWLVCEIYIKHPTEGLKYIKNNNLNKFIHNKSISKIRDSYRIKKEEKEMLNTLKRI